MTAQTTFALARSWRALSLLAACAVLAACSTGSSAVVDTLEVAISPNSAIKHAVLQPNVRYLRVEVDNRVALFALGYLDQDARGTTVEVWYGAGAEMLRLVNGRIVTAKGFSEELLAVSEPQAPAWDAGANADKSLSYPRSRDLMPRYRFSMLDTVSSTRLAQPPRSSIQGLDTVPLQWFSEQSDRAKHPDLYAVKFDGATATVLYSEQCPTPALCFILQEWPPGGNLHAN